MANHKSAKTRIVRNNKRSLINGARRSRVRTFVKKVDALINAKDKEAAVAAYNDCSSKLDKAVAKGIHHKNYASRQKARLAKAINEIA